MRQVGILGALLLAALIGSYLTWTADESDTSKSEQVLVYRAAADDISKLTWEGDGMQVVLDRKSDAKGPYVWVTVTETVTVEEPEEPVDTGAPEGPAAPGDTEAPTDTEAPDGGEAPEPETVTRSVSFKGNEAAEKVWEDFAPLHALRELQPGADTSAAAFGFDDPSGSLEVQRGSGPLTLVLGGETYGAKDRYAKLDERIFLLDDKTLRPLQYAKTRLVDRVVQPVDERDAETIEVAWSGRTVSLVHKNKDDRAAAFWARADSPAEEDTAAGTWVGKLMRLRVQDYDVPDDLSVLRPVFAFSVGDGDEVWSVEVLEGDGDDGTEYYARGDYSRGPVHLTESLATEVIADVETLFPAE